MASFAPGTSQQFMDDYYRRVGPAMGGTGQGMPRPPMARPDSKNSVTVGGGRASPYGQPSNRPFQGTLRPEVPQASQQAPDMSAYGPSRSAGMRWNGSQWTTPSARPGRAQPTQPQSQGMPYGQPSGAYDMDGRFTPNVPIPMSGMPSGQQRPVFSQPPSVAPGGGLGNLAYSPPESRPPPFTTSMRGPAGQQYDPSQFFPMRDAFIQNINDARSSFAMNPSAGRPQMDLGGMWNRAGQMAQQGYSNPLAGLMGGFG